MKQNPDRTWARWRWLAGYFSQRRRIVVFALAAGTAAAGANVALLLMLGHAIDSAIPSGNLTALLLVGAAMILSRLAAGGVAICMTQLSTRQVSAAIAEMQGTMAGRLHRLRWRDVQELDASAANARLVHDAHTVSQMAMRLATGALPALVPFLASVAVLFLIDPRLAAIVLILLPVTRALYAIGVWRLRVVTRRFWDRFDTFHRGTRQLLHMLPATKAHGVSARELAGHRSAGDNLADSHASMMTAVTASEQAGALGATILLAVILVGGGLAVANMSMPLGTLTAFLVAATQAQATLTALGGAIPALFNGDTALARIHALQMAGSEDHRNEGSPPAAGNLAFEDVSSRVGDRQILADISFELSAGQSVAIVAPNGEGKTTLLNIALGLIDCDSGRVMVDGVDLATLDRECWRRSLGILMQHPLFATATLGDNIGFGSATGDGSASRSQAVDALLDTLPVGPEASVGENGALLSGGERQRTAIARALGNAPSLLVLDEPTNHLDAGAVALLIEQLFMAPGRPTILMATHDARLLRHVDRAYSLEGGVLTPIAGPPGVAIAS